MHFLLSALPLFVEDAETLDFLLNEVLTSAAERCLDPTAMDFAVLESIATKTRTELDAMLLN